MMDRGIPSQWTRMPSALLAATATLLLAAQNARAELDLGVASPNLKVRPSDAPATQPTAVLKAARNEFEPFQIVLRSTNGPTAEVRVLLAAPLAGPGGASIPSENVTFYRVDYYQVGTASSSEGAPGRWPDPLVPAVDTFFGETRNAFPFDVPDGESRVVWVDLLVPADAVAGDYSGTLTVEAGGVAVGTIPISLHVGSFDLPSTATFKSAFGMGWADPCLAHFGNNSCDSGWNEEAATSFRTLYLRSALDHRFTISDSDFQPPFGGSATPYETHVMPLIDGTGPTRLDGAALTAVRLDGGDDDAGAWIDYAQTNGFFDRLFYYPVDEPHDGAAWSTLVASAAALHAANADARVIITSTIVEADENAATDSVDIFVPVVNYLDGKAGTDYEGNQLPSYQSWLASSASHEIWSYQSCMSHGCGDCATPTNDPYFTGWPSYVIDSSAVQNRCFPWVAFRLGITGELYFDATYQLATAWEADGQCAFSGSGDGTLLYPGKPSLIGGTEDIPIESVRMKLIREGREDYEYLVQAAAIDPEGAMAIATTLFPTAYDCAQSPAALEGARDELFALLDQGAGGQGGGGMAAGGAGGTGGTAEGGAGANAGGAAGSAAAPTQDGDDDGCGCRVGGTGDERRFGGVLALNALLGLAWRSRARRARTVTRQA